MDIILRELIYSRLAAKRQKTWSDMMGGIVGGVTGKGLAKGREKFFTYRENLEKGTGRWVL